MSREETIPAPGFSGRFWGDGRSAAPVRALVPPPRPLAGPQSRPTETLSEPVRAVSAPGHTFSPLGRQAALGATDQTVSAVQRGAAHPATGRRGGRWCVAGRPANASEKVLRRSLPQYAGT